MAAGDSADAEAKRQSALAALHRAEAARASDAAFRYGLAAVTEKATAIALAKLAPFGYHFLPDRAWPGTRHAQVDMVVIGPAGVFIVDTKAWADVTIVLGRIFRGQDDVTEDLDNIASLGQTTEADLAEIGLAPGEIHVVAVLAGEGKIKERVGTVDVVGEKDIAKHVASYGNRLTPRQVEKVLTRAMLLFPLVGERAPVSTAIAEPVAPAPEPVAPDDLPEDEEIAAAIMEGILAAPIEEWMTFLDPTQAKLVRRSFNGPARIRGPVGTGKTVVGLHRAAYLARASLATPEPGRVLVTTFVRTLPDVLSHLFAQMAPDVADRVDFMGIHGFANGLLRERGVSFNLDRDAAQSAFNAAWLATGRGGALARTSLPPKYWQEEIAAVLKGRGITRFDDYADLARAGRRYRLNVDQRRAMWDLFRDYENRLRAQHVNDDADRILLAEASLRAEPLDPPYAAVLVDEAQDLTCAMVRMLHGLVGDALDGFTLIGDGQQSIYPGGYTLAEAGVSVATRGVVLDVNYRNTAEILAFASTLVAGSEFEDIEGGIARGDIAREAARTGPEPVVERCGGVADHDARLAERARMAVQAVGTGWGDVGVLCLTIAGVDKAERALKAAGVPTVPLLEYDGTRVDAVKVGTIKRAKGLEFKHVLLPSVGASLLAEAPPSEDDVARERWELDRRALYVGMTRARDGLWVGVL